MTGGAYKTIIYLIENGFLDAKIIGHAVCPVVLELCEAKHSTFDITDRHANAVGVSVESFSYDTYQKINFVF